MDRVMEGVMELIMGMEMAIEVEVVMGTGAIGHGEGVEEKVGMEGMVRGVMITIGLSMMGSLGIGRLEW